MGWGEQARQQGKEKERESRGRLLGSAKDSPKGGLSQKSIRDSLREQKSAPMERNEQKKRVSGGKGVAYENL